MDRPFKNSRPCTTCPHRLGNKETKAKFRQFGNRCHEHINVYCFGAPVNATKSDHWKSFDQNDCMLMGIKDMSKKMQEEFMEVFCRERKKHEYPFTEIID